MARAVGNLPPDRSQFGAMGAPLDQRYPQPLFQRPQLMAQGWLGRGGGLCRLSEMAMIGHRDEIFELA